MAKSGRLVLWDTDEVLADALSAQFDHHGEFAVRAVTAPSATVDDLLHADETPPDLVLLGEAETGGAAALVAAIAEAPFSGPVVVLGEPGVHGERTASTPDRVVPRPVRFAVLVATLRAALRAHELSDDAIMRIGPFRFRAVDRQLSADDGESIALTDKEALILRHLFRAGGRPVSREFLLNHVWGYNSGVSTHTLETHIYRLRQKIEPNDSPSLLVTDLGGYRLAI